MIRVLLVDDERQAHELMSMELAALAPDFEVVQQCTSYDDAHRAMLAGQFDIVFLDIMMPRGNGLDLLKAFPNRTFYPVMVTGHSEYAIEAIRSEAFDYLLKPLDREELAACISRYRIHRGRQVFAAEVPQRASSRLEVKDRSSSAFIDHEDITYLEASGSYTTIYTASEKYVESHNLKSVSEQLDQSQFFRCSHQHVVNLKRVKSFSHETLTARLYSGDSVPVSVRRKSDFLGALRSL